MKKLFLALFLYFFCFNCMGFGLDQDGFCDINQPYYSDPKKAQEIKTNAILKEIGTVTNLPNDIQNIIYDYSKSTPKYPELKFFKHHNFSDYFAQYKKKFLIFDNKNNLLLAHERTIKKISFEGDGITLIDRNRDDMEYMMNITRWHLDSSLQSYCDYVVGTASCGGCFMNFDKKNERSRIKVDNVILDSVCYVGGDIIAYVGKTINEHNNKYLHATYLYLVDINKKSIVNKILVTQFNSGIEKYCHLAVSNDGKYLAVVDPTGLLVIYKNENWSLI